METKHLKLIFSITVFVVGLVSLVVFLSRNKQATLVNDGGVSPTSSVTVTSVPDTKSFTLTTQKTSGVIEPSFKLTLNLPSNTTTSLVENDTSLKLSGENFSMSFNSESDGGPSSYDEVRPMEALVQTSLGIPLYRILISTDKYVYSDDYYRGVTDCGSHFDPVTKTDKAYADCSWNTIRLTNSTPDSHYGLLYVTCDSETTEGVATCDMIIKTMQAQPVKN